MIRYINYMWGSRKSHSNWYSRSTEIKWRRIITDDSFRPSFLFSPHSVFYSHTALFFSPSFSRLFLATFLTRCIFVSDSRRLCRCVGVSSRRDPTKRTPLPRASLTIRRDCRKIRDTRKSISTAVGSDGVSRKSHCIGAPTRGRKTDASFLLSRARGGTREESRAYICNSVERANFLWLRIGC